MDQYGATDDERDDAHVWKDPRVKSLRGEGWSSCGSTPIPAPQ